MNIYHVKDLFTYFMILFILGQLTQWHLIFHGTETTPQIGEIPKTTTKKKTVNDLDHNSLENSWGFIKQDKDAVSL